MSKRELHQKARELRLQSMSMPDIAKTLGVAKSSVSNWVKDLPINLSKIETSNKIIARQKRAKSCQIAWAKKRQVAYDEGVQYYKENATPEFKQFIMLYLCEGYRKSRGCVSIANANVNIMKLGWNFLKSLAINGKFEITIYEYEGHDSNVLKKYWSEQLNVLESFMKIRRNSNSGNLKGRCNRLEYGYCSIRIGDTYLRSKMQAWMDLLQKEWEQNNFYKMYNLSAE